VYITKSLHWSEDINNRVDKRLVRLMTDKLQLAALLIIGTRTRRLHTRRITSTVTTNDNEHNLKLIQSTSAK